MYKRKDISDFEEGKLFFSGTRPFATNEKGSIDEFHYYGKLNFDGVYPEVISLFPDLIASDDLDDEKIDTQGLSLRDFFEQEQGENRFLLKKHLMNMPNGFYFTDPCYLAASEDGVDLEGESRDKEKIFPAGNWEVSIKGHLVADHVSQDILRDISDTKIEYISGWRVNGYRSRGSSCWVVKPGAEFVTIARKPIGSLGVDSGLAGVFPTDRGLYTWDDFLNEHETEQKDSNYAADVKKFGVYSHTSYGDGGYSIYELLDAESTVVGYVVSYNGSIDSETVLPNGNIQELDLAESGYLDDFAKKNASLKANLDGKLDFTQELKPPHRRVKAYGIFLSNENSDDMLFYFGKLPNGEFSLRVGVVDLEYRKKTEQRYIDQGIKKNGKPYLPTWDDNYPDRKIFEAVAKKSYLEQQSIQDIFMELLKNLQEVPVEKSLFM